MKNVIIIGSRGYNFNYGGWETFVTNFANYNNKKYNLYVPYLILNKEDYKGDYVVNNVNVHDIKTPKIGFAVMFQFTISSIRYYLKKIKKEKMKNTTVILLGCKVGPLMTLWYPKFKKLGVKVIINPDGLEWKREKWAWWIKLCFKISERCHVKYSDHVVCDSKDIKNYIDTKYQKYHKSSSFIAYGTNDLIKEKKDIEFTKKFNIKDENYYLIVGRFVPENNFKMIIEGFMKSKTKKDLVIVSNIDTNMKFYNKLESELHFSKDSRIKFVGSVYNQEALKYLRCHAYAYIHGHSAGGTNPSLLEALNSTNLNILYDVIYNREVGEASCLYFANFMELCDILNKVDTIKDSEYNKYGKKAKERIKNNYTWDIVSEKYKEIL